jgi:hypothetical protein
MSSVPVANASTTIPAKVICSVHPAEARAAVALM